MVCKTAASINGSVGSLPFAQQTGKLCLVKMAQLCKSETQNKL